MAAPNQITAAQLSRLVGTPDAPMLVDVRLDADFALNPALIPASFRHPHSDLAALVTRLAEAKSVIICQRGRKLSEGVAALLRSHGLASEVLEGGADAWAALALPMVPVAAIPATNTWVTRQRPKVDRIACPWLIRRFVDPTARFLFVAPSEVQSVADRFDATPFDIDGVAWSHDGPDCTFDTMVRRFGLSAPAMDRLATVVRAADTDRHDLAPQAAGLLALSVGLSRMFRDDLQQLEAGMTLYDALYRWARDGFDEGHDWPAGRAQ